MDTAQSIRRLALVCVFAFVFAGVAIAQTPEWPDSTAAEVMTTTPKLAPYGQPFKWLSYTGLVQVTNIHEVVRVWYRQTASCAGVPIIPGDFERINWYMADSLQAPNMGNPVPYWGAFEQTAGETEGTTVFRIIWSLQKHAEIDPAWQIIYFEATIKHELLHYLQPRADHNSSWLYAYCVPQPPYPAPK